MARNTLREDMTPEQRRKMEEAKAKHPLIGTGLHWKDEDGAVQHQAVVVDVVPSGNAAVGDLALIQYFEWPMGEPSTRRLIPLVELASAAPGKDRWVLYRDVDDMNDHYERRDKHQNEHIRRRREKAKVEAEAVGAGEPDRKEALNSGAFTFSDPRTVPPRGNTGESDDA
jgi:hypothetical protein